MFAQADLSKFLSDNGLAVVALIALGFGIWRALPHVVENYLKKIADLKADISACQKTTQESKEIVIQLIDRFQTFDKSLADFGTVLARLDRHVHALSESAKSAIEVTAIQRRPKPPTTDPDVSIIGEPGIKPEDK